MTMFFLAKDGGRGRNDVIKSQPLPFMRPAIVIVIAKSMEGKKDTARDGKLMIFFSFFFISSFLFPISTLSMEQT